MDSVPIVLLASGDRMRGQLRKLHGNTSTFLTGPFGVRRLRVLVSGLMSGIQHVHNGCDNTRKRGTGVRRVRMGNGGSTLVREIVGCVGRRLTSPSLGMRGLARSMNVDHTRLRHGLGRVTNISTNRFVHGLQLRRTTHLVRRKRVGVARMTCSMKFDGRARFSAIFGGRCNVSPDRCTRAGEGRGWAAGGEGWNVFSCLYDEGGGGAGWQSTGV